MSSIVPVTSSLAHGTSEYDLLQKLLSSKRSANTRRAYQKSVNDFFQSMFGLEAVPVVINAFLALPRAEAIGMVLEYQASLLDRKLAEATVNNRLAALKSLVKYAHALEQCAWTLEDVQGETVETYRDTTGVDIATYKKILKRCDRTTLKGKRDYAIFRLLLENVLRRDEVGKIDIEHVDWAGSRFKVFGKGRGMQFEWMSLSKSTLTALQDWLAARGDVLPSDPLFIALDRAHYGHRITGDGLYKLVRSAAERAGIEKRLSPHRIRHSGITAAIDAGKPLAEVQKLSRHKRIDVLMRYYDNLKNAQKGVTDELASMLD